MGVSAQARSVARFAGPAPSRAPLDPRSILTSIGEIVYDWDLTSDALVWGANAGEVLGLRDLGGLASGRALALAVEPGSGRTRHDAIFASTETDLGTGVPYRTRYAVRLGPDKVLRVEDTGRWYADGEGRAMFAHGVLRVERAAPVAEAEEGVSRERADFLDWIKADVVEAGRTRRPLSLLVLAVEDLGRINDELGHATADAVLAEVCGRVRRVMRRRDRLVRYAGNRIAVALLSCPAEQVALAAARVTRAVDAEPVATPRGPVAARIRLGAATAPEHAVEAPGLLRRAEEALAAARREGGEPFVLFRPALPREGARDGAGSDLLDALNTRRITFALQPVRDARTGGIAFHEALLRVRQRDGRLVRAGEVLGAVEQTALMPLVDAYMLGLVADHLARHPDAQVALNVSPLTLEGPDWLTTLAAHLGARPGIASRLIVEITETAAVRDPRATGARLDAMKALGVGIAIDDFGAGHTSFKHLRSFPVDLVKIDGAFVQNLARSTDDRFFVRALVDLAHHLGIPIVAEWVSDEETARLLAEWGVDYLQGDHCGVPALVEGEPAGAHGGTQADQEISERRRNTVPATGVA
jgi:diguanylate cyclase (GGDEF)-like protein